MEFPKESDFRGRQSQRHQPEYSKTFPKRHSLWSDHLHQSTAPVAARPCLPLIRQRHGVRRPMEPHRRDAKTTAVQELKCSSPPWLRRPAKTSAAIRWPPAWCWLATLRTVQSLIQQLLHRRQFFLVLRSHGWSSLGALQEHLIWISSERFLLPMQSRADASTEIVFPTRWPTKPAAQRLAAEPPESKQRWALLPALQWEQAKILSAVQAPRRKTLSNSRRRQ